MSWTWLLYLSSGVVATIIAAHVMTSKSRQAPPPSEEKPVPSTTNVEVNVYPSLYLFPVDIAEADPELARQLDELERRIEQNKSRSASPVVDQRHLEFARYLVETGRLNEDL